MKRLRDLPGLGPKSEARLQEIGIKTEQDLRQTGPIPAFLKLKRSCSIRPSLNFLYALVGAVEGESWLKVAQQEKARLLMELEGYEELEQLLQSDLSAKTGK